MIFHALTWCKPLIIMILVKQKTFEFDGQLAATFEDFCRENLLVEKRVAAVAILHYMKADAVERDKMVQQLKAWLDEHGEPESKGARGVAPKRTRGKTS